MFFERQSDETDQYASALKPHFVAVIVKPFSRMIIHALILHSGVFKYKRWFRNSHLLVPIYAGLKEFLYISMMFLAGSITSILKLNTILLFCDLIVCRCNFFSIS